MMGRVALTLVLLGMYSDNLAAQEILRPGEPREVALAAGSRHDFGLELVAGDYVTGSVNQRDIVVFATAFAPDGSLVRAFPGQPVGERPLKFIAETTGRYRLSLTVPTVENAARNGLQIPPSATSLVVLESVVSLAGRQRRARDAPLRSPRMEALRRGVEQRNGDVTAFWEGVRKSTTPLIEPDAEDARYQLVTFLWRGRPGDRNIIVVGSFGSDAFASGRPPGPAMQRLGETDVWFVTIRLPRGARFTYRLSPNDPLFDGEVEAAAREVNLQVDPLNPRRTVNRPGASRFEGVSLAELPGDTIDDVKEQVTVPVGTFAPVSIPASDQSGSRQAWVYTPANVASSTVHNLLILFDGELYLSAGAPAILDRLIGGDRISPTVAVFVSSSSTRATELLGNDAFSTFVARELVPWIRARYQLSTDPARTIVAGTSAGGVAAAYAAFKYPDVFGKVMSQSGAFDWAPEHSQYGLGADATTEPNAIARLYRDASRLPLEFYLDAGTFETDVVGTGGFVLEPIRHLRDVLLAKGYAVHYRQFVGGHDTVNLPDTFGDALVQLIGTQR